MCEASAASNEIRATEENSLKIIASDVTSVNMSWNFSVPWNDPLVQVTGFVSNSFCDLVQSTAITEKQLRTNTLKPNEFTDFENFVFEHPRCPKTILDMTFAERPCTGIHLAEEPLYESYHHMRGERRKQWNSRQRIKFIENHSFRPHQREYFMKFSIFEFFRLHGKPPWSANSLSLQIRFAIWHHQSKAKDK